MAFEIIKLTYLLTYLRTTNSHPLMFADSDRRKMSGRMLPCLLAVIGILVVLAAGPAQTVSCPADFGPCSNAQKCKNMCKKNGYNGGKCYRRLPDDCRTVCFCEM